MYRLRYEGGVFSKERSAIEACVPERMNKVVKAAENVGNALIQRWFGSKACPGGTRYAAFNAKRKAMSAYLNNQCQVLTFVKAIYGHRVDSAVVEKGDYAQVMRSCFTKEGGEAVPGFVPSGLRIYLLGTGFVDLDEQERFNTIAHEISHRVLDTTDYWYGKNKSLARAVSNSSKCVDCAENWGYFYQEVDAQTA